MIAVDICNSLADVNAELQKHLPVLNTYPCPLPKSFFSSPEGLCVFRDAKPMQGVVEVINYLSEIMGGVIYVTSRPKEAEFITRRWLKRHGFPRAKIIFCHWDEKPAIYDSLKPQVIIEDDPRVLEAIKDLGVLILAPQWFYNQHVMGSKILQVDKWDKESILMRSH